MELIKWDAIAHEIATNTDIQQLSDIRNKLTAYKELARQTKQSMETQNKIAEYRLRVDRKLGEWSASLEKEKPGKKAEAINSTMELIDEKGKLDYFKEIEIAPTEMYRKEVIASLPEEVFENHITETKTDKKELTSAGVLRLAKKEEQKAYFKELEDYDKPFNGLYDVVVVDPPWDMQKIDREVTPTQTGFDYPTMTEQELSEMELPLATDCHVFIWTTHKFLPSALRLVDIWALKYTLTFVWHKNGGFQPFGLPQYNNEFIVYARKGNPKFRDIKNFFTCFQADRTGHSKKPASFYENIRRVTAGRRIDIFNKRGIEGFERWGNESGD